MTIRALGRVVVAGWLAFCCVAALAQGEARESYRKGVEALEAGRWAEAENAFREAIADRGEEKVTSLRRDYLPHYQLGVTLAEQGKCRGALVAWAESERQGQVQRARKNEHQDLARRQKACRDAVQAVEEARAAAERALAGARKASTVVEELHQTAELEPDWDEGSPSFEGRQRAADRRLRAASDRLSAITSDELTPLEEIRGQAIALASELDAVAADARRRLQEVNASEANALENLESNEQRAEEQLHDLAYLSPFPDGLGRQVAEVRRNLNQVVERKGIARSDELTRLASALRNSVSRLRRAAKGPPASLKKAAEAYLAGDFEDVIALLAGKMPTEAREASHFCLLRAASRHAIYVLTGEADEELSAALSDDVAACGALDPPPKIPSQFFSPSFVSFYEATLLAQAEATLDEEGEGEVGEENAAADPTSGEGTRP